MPADAQAGRAAAAFHLAAQAPLTHPLRFTVRSTEFPIITYIAQDSFI